jgi:hypothetical protein
MAAGNAEHSRGEVAVVIAAKVCAVVFVGSEVVLVACYLFDMVLDMKQMMLYSMDNLALGAAFGLPVPSAVSAFLERRPAPPTHSFHDHDRWSRGFVLVEAAEILTWAERGMPLNEHCRTPLWPNSNPEKNAPGLIYLDVRRVWCTNDRVEVLRIAWKRLGEERNPWYQKLKSSFCAFGAFFKTCRLMRRKLYFTAPAWSAAIVDRLTKLEP